MIGPGKYDDVATELREKLKAKGIFLMVIDGKEGSGFSVQVESQVSGIIPGILKRVAGEITRDHDELARQIHSDFKKHPEDQDWGGGGTSCSWNRHGD